MNLIIDIGNTKIKASLFLDGNLIISKTSEQSDTGFAREILAEYNIQKAIISSVREYPEELVKLLQENTNDVFFFDASLPVPIENLYESKNTLGYDRLAACIGAYAIYPNQNILVVDAGTAITFDLVNEDAQYLGGCISPGLQMRFKALHQFTKKLPQLSQSDDFHLIGKNTRQAITGGVQNGMIFEVDSYIAQLKAEYKDLKVVLTGGDASFLHHHITNDSVYEPNILAIGLNRILDFNTLESPNN